MTRRLPPLNALRAFEAAARLGSFKLAAEEAHVTHGAISRHVQLLEDWLGAPLFHRQNRRVVLTQAGTTYLAEIGPALDRIASATERYRGGRERRTLWVNALPTFTVRWLLPRLARFHTQHPDIAVSVATSNLIVEAVGEPSDLVIRTGPDTFEGYRTHPFLTERRLPVCSPSILGKHPLKRPDDLRHHTLLHCATRPRFWGQWLKEARVPELKPAGNLTLDHYYLALEAAIGGLGVAMGPISLILPELAARRLVMPFPDLEVPARSYCYYLPEKHAGDAAVIAFCDWLVQEGVRCAAKAGAVATVRPPPGRKRQPRRQAA